MLAVEDGSWNRDRIGELVLVEVAEDLSAKERVRTGQH